MNCLNCGAAMTLNARGVYLCAHCGTTSFPETIDRDGIRILGRDDTSLTCSLCASPLAHGLLDEHRVEYCEKCRGILVPRRDFADLVHRRRAWAEGISVMPAPANVAELRRKLSCPRCAAQMTTDWYYGPGNVIIDRCIACDLVWLDYGELKQIVDAPGIDRGSHDMP